MDEFTGCMWFRLQNEVDEVVDIMQNNIGHVMERGERLEDLHDKSGEWTPTEEVGHTFSTRAAMQMTLAFTKIVGTIACVLDMRTLFCY